MIAAVDDHMSGLQAFQDQMDYIQHQKAKLSHTETPVDMCKSSISKRVRCTLTVTDVVVYINRLGKLRCFLLFTPMNFGPMTTYQGVALSTHL